MHKERRKTETDSEREEKIYDCKRTNNHIRPDMKSSGTVLEFVQHTAEIYE